MSFRFSASRILHEEHMASLGLLREVERAVVLRKTPPAPDDGETTGSIRRLRNALAGEVTAHFDFEEDALFPYLTECGEGDLAELLVEEHQVLRDVFRELDAQAGPGLKDGFSPEGWATFRRLCGELIERLQSHVEKEEQALLPALENALTSETDAEFSARHDI
jgi:hemerythrin-like domain-containing protein